MEAQQFGDKPKGLKKTRRYVPHRLRSVDSANKRNARERRRQCRINTALDRLQSHLPESEEGKREGKEYVMRRAISYIRYLRKMLGYAEVVLPTAEVCPADILLTDEDLCIASEDYKPMHETIPVPASAVIFAARRLAEFSSPIHDSRTGEVIDLTEPRPEVPSRSQHTRVPPITKGVALTFTHPTPDTEGFTFTHTTADPTAAGHSDILSQLMSMIDDDEPGPTKMQDPVDFQDIFSGFTPSHDVADMDTLVGFDDLDLLAESLSDSSNDGIVYSERR